MTRRGLADTLRDQLAAQFLRINGLPGVLKFTFGGESPIRAATGELLGSREGRLPADRRLARDRREARLLYRACRSAAAIAPGGGSPGKPGLPALSAGLLALAADPLSAAVLDRMPSGSAAELARKFRQSAAPLRRMIAEAKSPDDLMSGVKALSIGWDANSRAALLTEALTTYAVNGAVHIEP